MFPRWFVHITAVCVSLIAAFPAMSVTLALAKRNLTVQLRQVEEGGNSGYAVGTKAGEALMTEQIVNVGNGEMAVFNKMCRFDVPRQSASVIHLAWDLNSPSFFLPERGPQGFHPA